MKNPLLSLAKNFILLSPIFIYAFDAYARAGGGGGSCDGWICAIVAPFVAAYFGYISYRISKKRLIVSKALADMAVREPLWEERLLLEMAKDKFMLLQDAWSKQDLGVIKQHLHTHLFPDWERDIEGQITRGERNIVERISITKASIVDVQNFEDDARDQFTVAFKAKCRDYTVDNLTHKVKIAEGGKIQLFLEFWTFAWENNEWRLLEVSQFDDWARFVNAPIIYEFGYKYAKHSGKFAGRK